MASVVWVDTRSAMAALPSPSVGQTVFLTEVGREGAFVCKAGTAPADPQQGLYIASTAAAGFYYSRVWDLVNGRPEWFGAVPGAGADCLANIQAAIALCPVVVFGNDDYYLSSTLKINTARRKLTGHRGRAQARFEGTRLIVQSATADTLQIGPDSLPLGGINSFLSDVSVSCLTVTRDRQPNISAQNTSQPTGLRLKYVLNAEVDNVFSGQHAIAYYYGGVVASHFSNNFDLRSVPSSGISDFYYGHFLDGSLTGVGAGGNASVYIENCSSNVAISLSGDAIGMVIDGSFSDTFVRDYETASFKKGILIVGTGSAGGSASNIDIVIDHPVLDACTDRGIEIAAVSKGGVVAIIEPYAAVTGTSALACYHVHDGLGTVKFLGGQAICESNTLAGGNALGLYADTQVGLIVHQLSLIESKRPLALLSCTDADLAPDIRNLNTSATQSAAYLSASSRIRLAPSISGGSNLFPSGVALVGAANSRVLVDWTRINDSTVAGGSVNRLVVNGAQVTSTGAFAGGVASGA